MATSDILLHASEFLNFTMSSNINLLLNLFEKEPKRLVSILYTTSIYHFSFSLGYGTFQSLIAAFSKIFDVYRLGSKKASHFLVLPLEYSV